MERATDEQIEAQLRDVQDENEVTVVSARIRGSHRQGVAHEDSDTDVMFLFKQDPERYAGLLGYTGTIHAPDDPVDLHGWNVDFFGELLSDSNPDAVNYLHSPDAPIPDTAPVDELADEVGDQFNRMALYHHFLSMARSNYQKYIESGKDMTVNRVYHVLHATACAKHIRVTNDRPPLDAFDLVDADVLGEPLTLQLQFYAGQKERGRVGLESADCCGKYLHAEENVDMDPTDERTQSPDKRAIHEFIVEALDAE